MFNSDFFLNFVMHSHIPLLRDMKNNGWSCAKIIEQQCTFPKLDILIGHEENTLGIAYSCDS